MTTTTRPINVAVDPGNATVVALTDRAAVFFPSFVASVGVSAYDGPPLAGTDYHHITRANRHSVIGAAAIDWPGADTLLNAALPPHRAWERYTSPRSVDAALAAICALLPDQPAVVKLATGLPSTLMDAAYQVQAALTGQHDLTYNGTRRTVVVTETKVYAETLEAARLLTPTQRIGKVAIHDLGGRTWGVASLRAGKARAFDFGTDRLLDACGVSTDPAIRWHILQEMRQSAKAHTPLRKALAGVVGDVLTVIEEKVPLDIADRHVLIGGLAPLVAPMLTTRYKGAEVVTLCDGEPERVNAAAYLAALREAGR